MTWPTDRPGYPRDAGLERRFWSKVERGGRGGREVSDFKIEVVEGASGKSLYLGNFRIAGPKPWGGGPTIMSFTVKATDLSAALGVPVGTLAGLRSGEMVAVPREPTPDFWPSYCAANGAMPGSAWDTLSQKLYSAIIAHHARRSQGRAP